MFILDPDLDFYPSRIPDPGVKKAPDPRSAALKKFKTNFGSGMAFFWQNIHSDFGWKINAKIA